MAGKVVQLKNVGEVRFLKNKRSKNIKISVKPDKSVLVSFPFYCSTKEAMLFVRKNEQWVLDQQKKMEQRKSKINADSIIKTKLHTVQFILGEKYNIEAKENNVLITVKDFETERSQSVIEDLLVQIYRYEAKKILPPRLSELANKFGFQFQRVTIRNNKRNWGSCSSQNNISLNLQMMKLPDYLIDYILLHELVHTEIKDHSSRFWNRLNELTNGTAKQLSKEVKQYSTYTL